MELRAALGLPSGVLSLIVVGVLSATEPSAVASGVIEWLDHHPDAGVQVVPRGRRDTITHALRLGSLACEVSLNEVRCREQTAADRESFASGTTLSDQWDAGLVEAPGDARLLISALQSLPNRKMASVREVGRQRSRVYELSDESGPGLVIFDGAAHRLSGPLPGAPSYSMPSLEAFPLLDASSLFPKGTRAWGAVLVEGDQGNGNNASGGYNYLLAILALKGEQLEFVATHPLGGTAFSRFVGDDGFHLWDMHTLLCPSISAGVLTLTPSCRGAGDPRSFSPPFATLCQQAREGKCSPYGTKQTPEILAGRGQFVLRGEAFVPANAKPIRPLADVRKRDAEEDPAGKKAELIVSERPWVADAENPVEWVELENRSSKWIDLRGLEARPLFEQTALGKIEHTCVIAPQGTVVLRAGKGPSWNARGRDCFLGEKAVLRGHFALLGPQGEIVVSWSSGGPISGYSMHCNPMKGCQLGRESPGTRD